MQTESSSQDKQEQSSLPESQTPDPALIFTLAEELESDENVEKLGKKLTEEWSKPATNNKVPDLRFSKFLDKLKKSKHQ